MKRLVTLSLALLLVLPLLVVPCFASSVYTFTYSDNSNEERDLYGCVGVVPEGVYNVEFYVDGSLIGTSVSPFTLAYTHSGEIYSFSVLVPVSFMGENFDFLLDGGYLSYASEGTFLRIPPSDAPELLTIRFVSVSSSDVSVLDGFGTVAAAVIDWVGQIAAAIVEHPFLLVTVGIFFVGGCIALFGRLLSRN